MGTEMINMMKLNDNSEKTIINVLRIIKRAEGTMNMIKSKAKCKEDPKRKYLKSTLKYILDRKKKR